MPIYTGITKRAGKRDETVDNTINAILGPRAVDAMTERANAANRARNRIQDTVRGAVKGAFDAIAEGLPERVTSPMRAVGRLPFEMLRTNDKMTPEEFVAGAATDLSPAPLVMGGVWAGRQALLETLEDVTGLPAFSRAIAYIRKKYPTATKTASVGPVYGNAIERDSANRALASKASGLFEPSSKSISVATGTMETRDVFWDDAYVRVLAHEYAHATRKYKSPFTSVQYGRVPGVKTAEEDLAKSVGAKVQGKFIEDAGWIDDLLALPKDELKAHALEQIQKAGGKEERLFWHSVNRYVDKGSASVPVDVFIPEGDLKHARKLTPGQQVEAYLLSKGAPSVSMPGPYTERTIKAMKALGEDAPPPGEITRYLVRGDLEAGVPFQKVAGGGSRLTIQGLRASHNSMYDVLGQLVSYTPKDDPAGQSIIKKPYSLWDKLEVTPDTKKLALADDVDALRRAARKAFPKVNYNPTPNRFIAEYDRGKHYPLSQVILEQESGPNFASDIRAQRRGEYPSVTSVTRNNRPGLNEIREERASEGPIAFGPWDWINTRADLPVGTLEEEAHAVVSPTSERGRAFSQIRNMERNEARYRMSDQVFNQEVDRIISERDFTPRTVEYIRQGINLGPPLGGNSPSIEDEIGNHIAEIVSEGLLARPPERIAQWLIENYGNEISNHRGGQVLLRLFPRGTTTQRAFEANAGTRVNYTTLMETVRRELQGE